MKRYILPIIAAVLSSCCGPVAVTTVTLADSTANVLVEAQLDMPTDNPFRDTLTDILYRHLSTIGVYGDERSFPKSTTPADYIRSLTEFLDSEYVKDSQDMPVYHVSITMRKISDTTDYVVFDCMSYVELGGVHGGITGPGTVIIDKRNGNVLRGIIDTSAVTSLQPILRKGLLDYINATSYDVPISDSELDDNLLLFGAPIPIPSWEPVPTATGLTFTYQQYEVAPYSMGMPSFTVPFSDISPYITPQARSLLGI